MGPYGIHDEETLRRLFTPDPVPTKKVRAAQNPKAGPGAMSEIAQNAKTLWDILADKSVSNQKGVGRGQPVSEESSEQRTTFRDMATTGLNPRYNPTATMSPESQVGEIKRRPGLREKGSNLSLRDAAATPSTRRQGAATPSRNAPTEMPGAPGSDYGVEVIRGLNRSFTQFGRNEDGSWSAPTRKIDFEKMPGMGERKVYDSADPNYNEALQYGQDQEHDITLKDLENKGRLDVQALRNKGALQRQKDTGKNSEAAKLATEISKSLYDDEGTKPVDLRTAAHELARLREMDEREAFKLFTTMKDEHREKIIAFWKKMGFI